MLGRRGKEHRMTGLSSRLPVLLAVAFIAAAIGDPLVETIANTGILGPGYADNDHSSVIPTLIAGGMLAAVVLLMRAFGLLRARFGARELARNVAAASPLRYVPIVIVLELATLCAMENGEQLFFDGRLVHGLAWLGGPVLFSLCAHALLSVACIVLAIRSARTFVRCFASIVVHVFSRLLDARRRVAGAFSRRRDVVCVPALQQFGAQAFGQRAPPRMRAALT
jgi:hypothetical protein